MAGTLCSNELIESITNEDWLACKKSLGVGRHKGGGSDEEESSEEEESRPPPGIERNIGGGDEEEKNEGKTSSSTDDNDLISPEMAELRTAMLREEEEEQERLFEDWGQHVGRNIGRGDDMTFDDIIDWMKMVTDEMKGTNF